MSRVITYRMEQDFIREIADFIGREYIEQGRDLSRLAIVFGGKRPALFLKQSLAKKIKQGFFPPVFFSIDEFVDYTLRKKVSFAQTSDLDLSYVIFHLARKVTPDILKTRRTFAAFLPWAQEILSFIELLDLENIPAKILKNIQANAEIGYAIPPDINMLLEHLVVLREACHRHLEEQGVFTRGLRYLKAAQQVEEIEFEEFDQILFCNFFSLHRTEGAIIKSLADRNKAMLFFQGNEGEWPVLKRTAALLDMSIAPDQETTVLEQELHLYAGFDTHSQVGLVRQILKSIKNPDRAVIVLPEPDHVVPLLSEISLLVRDFNVSMGYPLKRSSLYTLFQFIFKAQSTRKGKLYYARDYLKVLRHPFVKNLNMAGGPSAIRILIHKIEEILTGQIRTSMSGQLFLDPEDMENLDDLYLSTLEVAKKMGIATNRAELKGSLQQLHQVLFVSWAGMETFERLAVVLGNFLDLLFQKSFMEGYPLNLKIAERILSIRDELKAAAFSREIFPGEEIFRIFESKVEREIVAFLGSPLKGLQILGLFETRSLNFEHVIMMDVNEGILPRLRIYEPLIPREVMVSLNLDRLEQEEEIQRYQFIRLISAAKNVHLVYQESRDKERSRFIEDLIWQRQKKEGRLEVAPVTRAGFAVKILPRQTVIRKTPEVLALLKNLTYSVSSINSYIQCPLRFYYKYVLGLQEREDLLEEPETREVGTFVHNLLEDAFRPFVGRPPVVDATFINRFQKMLDQRFADQFGRSMKSDSFLLKHVLDVRMNRFLKKEQERSVKELRNVSQLLYLEQRFEDVIPLSSAPAKFVYKMDRIDQLEDGTIVILDYKTGGRDPMPRNFEIISKMPLSRESIRDNIRSFQVPLYFYYLHKNYRQNNLNAAFYNLRTLEIDRFIGNNQAFLVEEINRVFLQALDFIMAEILNPDVPFAPDDHDVRYCASCPFYNVCR